MEMKPAKEKHDERKAQKQITRKEKYSRAFNKAVQGKDGADTGTKKSKAATSIFDEAYARAGPSGADLPAAGRYLIEHVLKMSPEDFFERVDKEVMSMLDQPGNPIAEHLNWPIVKRYVDSKKITESDVHVVKNVGDGREERPFRSSTLDDDLDDGCVMVWDNPQKVNAGCWRLGSLLEAFFKETVEMKAITLGPNSSIAPFFDCANRFVIQLESSSIWTIYGPKGESDEAFPDFPVESSGIIEKEELKTLELDRTITLRPGDVVYVPRGFTTITKFMPASKGRSLLLTIGLRTHRTTWGDLIERTLLKALTVAKAADSRLREPLPKAFETFMGIQHVTDEDDEGQESEKSLKRAEFELNILKLIKSTVMKRLNVDSGADDMVARYMFDRMRPALKGDYDNLCIDDEIDEDEAEVEEEKLSLNSEVELRAKDCARICIENGTAVVRHCMKNSRIFQGNEERGIEFDLDDAPTVEAALTAFEGPFTIGSLPEVLVADDEDAEDDGGRVRVASIMLREGILQLVKY